MLSSVGVENKHNLWGAFPSLVRHTILSELASRLQMAFKKNN